jgi:hypothetical protein
VEAGIEEKKGLYKMGPSVCVIRFLNHRQKGFNTMLKNILYVCKSNTKACNGIDTQCVRFNKKTKKREIVIDKTYVRTKMLPNIQYIWWSEREVDSSKTKKKKEFCGFLLGRARRLLPRSKKIVFYVDLLCSAHRQGGKLLAHAEDFARSKNYSRMALRAASPHLLRYYRSKGYKRVLDACARPSRRARALLRGVLDSNAIEFVGNDYKYMDGWWMSKCLV